MDGEFPEQFKCPICFEIPDQEIFQCQNGHTICNVCVESLSICPQCRVSLGTSKIRNRGLEDILDMMKFNCSFKSDGCQAKVTRREITSHDENCLFGGERATLCKHLGFQCDYQLNTRHLEESLNHLTREHSISIMNEVNIVLNLENLKKTSYDFTYLWNPVILNVHNGKYLLVVYSYKDSISVTCFVFGNELNDRMQVKFGMTSTLDNDPVLEWITKPIPMKKSKSALSKLPFQFCLDLSNGGYFEINDLHINISLSDNNFNDSKSVKSIVKSGPFRLPSNERNRWLFQDTVNSALSKEIWSKLHAKFTNTLRYGLEGSECNVCLTFPIKGIIYTCLQCAQYDLCSACMMKNEHAFHHFTFFATNEQIFSFITKVVKGGKIYAFADCTGEKKTGYKFGSIESDAKELRCQKCRYPPDYICLKCQTPFGLCKHCFLSEFEKHDKTHYFCVTMNDGARQFALYVLREHKILGRLANEIIK